MNSDTERTPPRAGASVCVLLGTVAGTPADTEDTTDCVGEVWVAALGRDVVSRCVCGRGEGYWKYAEVSICGAGYCGWVGVPGTIEGHWWVGRVFDRESGRGV